MKNLKAGLSLTVLAATLAAVPVSGASAAPTPPQARDDDSLVQDMKADASGAIALRRSPATGEVGFARARGRQPDLLPAVDAGSERGAVAKADSYLADYAPVFGARPSQLEQAEVIDDGHGGWTVVYTQSHDDVPVFGAELHAHVSADGRLTSVNGFAAPDARVSTDPRISEDDARARALAMVEDRPSGYEDGLPEEFTEDLEVRSSELMIYRTGSPRGIDGESVLAWVLEVWNQSTVRETVILDAQTGKPVNRWSMMAHALDRELIEAGGSDDPAEFETVWTEGDPFPADLNQDQQNEVLGAAETYWMFENTFGYDSWDGAGGQMITVNNDGRINCPNANWNGVTTNYCNGVTGDDTVAHEWGHAYTESTSGLIYQWQSGAMNEAYSDIWGETVDMLNARHNELGEDPDNPVLRTEGNCSDFTRFPITAEILSPAGVAGDCPAAPASFGPTIGQTPIQADVVVGLDNDSDGPVNDDPIVHDTTTNGCEAYTNAGDISGKWVFVDRGFCTFAAKLDVAEAAGAIGIVIGDNRPEAPFSVAGDSPLYGAMVDQASGTRIKSVGAVTMEFAAVEVPTDESYRWLSGENDPAFGGAIRDLWNPNCYGDPGSVSDEEYHCDETDSGGVHTNSGVVNRTFAILVDGLPGKVDAIGLDKAANLFWNAQLNYLTPTSYFPDLADALEGSCTDLTGMDLNRVTLGSPTEADGSDGAATPEVITGGMTAGDCAAVTDAIAETELRMDPTEQCAWEPLLQPGEPPVHCRKGWVEKVAFEEDFEDGLSGWTQDEELTFPEGDGFPWEASTTAPEHEGGVAFGPDPVEGNCSGAAGDISSRNGLISPEIVLPNGKSPRLTFDHYVATESLWDGANLKVSVNGSDFELLPDAAYVFNGPEGSLQPEVAGNTNPMAGEPAWTGTDGGQLDGSWGTTAVKLGGVAGAGDTVQFRFDLGRDGCNGVDGWYVDNVTVASCKDVVPFETDTEVVWVKPKRVTKGESFRVKAKVTADDRTPKGEVVIKKDGKVLARGMLDDGKVVIEVSTRKLELGKHELAAVYVGNDRFERSKDLFTVRVVRR